MSAHCIKLCQCFLLLLLLSTSGVAGTLSIIGQSRWVQVVHVYDGDTVRTNTGERIRLLGINTPEVPNNDQPGQIMGMKAKQRLTELVAGQTVHLQTDREKQDIYGRTLAQIYLRNGDWINAQMVREGLAHVYTFAPNFRWAGKLLQAEAEARNSKRGIWKTGRFRLLADKDISRRHIGQFRVVEGVVSAARKWRFQVNKLRVSIPRKYRHQWFKNGLPAHNGQAVTLHGIIRLSGSGHLYMALHSPADLEVSP